MVRQCLFLLVMRYSERNKNFVDSMKQSGRLIKMMSDMSKGNTLLYFGDKNVSKVSGVWKALHVSISAAIAITAFVTAMAAGNMFQTFKYNCVLFCTNLEFEMTSENGTVLQEDDYLLLTGGNDSTLVGIINAKIDVRKSMFPPNFWCDFVLGIALVTFVFATFFVVLLSMCSKGGKGRDNTLNRPQNMIYPILICSIVLGVLNLVSALVVKDGMRSFCATFERFTGEKNCSPAINKFTLHERQSNFYLPYVVLSHVFNVTVVLFVGQVILILLRVIYAVDYQLYALRVEEEDETEHIYDVEDGQIVVKERAV